MDKLDITVGESDCHSILFELYEKQTICVRTVNTSFNVFELSDETLISWAKDIWFRNRPMDSVKIDILRCT